MSTFTAFTQGEAAEAVETVSTAMDDPAVFRALLATPGLLPRCAAALAILEDYVNNARPLTVTRGDGRRPRPCRPRASAWRLSLEARESRESRP